MNEAGSTWRDEVVRLLWSPSLEDWLEAQRIIFRNRPEHLYRYRPATDQQVEFLRQGTVWLGAADKFNDLFDTSTHVDTRPQLELELEDQLRRGALPFLQGPREAPSLIECMDLLAVREFARHAGPDVPDAARGYYEKYLRKENARMAKWLTERLQTTTRVACFCETWENQLLWAHYADDSRGFCVEYAFADIPARDMRSLCLYPVIYSDRPFQTLDFVPLIREHSNPCGPTLAAMHKHSRWSIEQEWRFIVSVGTEPAGLSWAMRPSRILTGARMSGEAREKLDAVAAHLGVPIVATKTDSPYGLVIDE